MSDAITSMAEALASGAAKVVGLTLCLGGGLDVGKEGPFVHTSW